MEKIDEAKEIVIAMVAEIDEAELTVRMIEAAMEIERLHPDPRVCLAHGIETELGEMWHRAARAAFDYFRECMQAGQAPQ